MVLEVPTSIKGQRDHPSARGRSKLPLSMSYKTLLANAIGSGMESKSDRFCRFLHVIPGSFLAQTASIPFIVAFANRVLQV